MMDLMEYKPESILVPQHVPPIKEKCSDEPAHESFRKRHVPRRQFDDRDPKEVNPKPCRYQNNSELCQIYSQRTAVPAFRFGQFAPRERSLRDEKNDGCKH